VGCAQQLQIQWLASKLVHQIQRMLRHSWWLKPRVAAIAVVILLCCACDSSVAVVQDLDGRGLSLKGRADYNTAWLERAARSSLNGDSPK
jgi:hypothetical protein